MSGKRAKRERRERKTAADRSGVRELVDQVAAAVLATDLSDVPIVGRVEQVAVGLCRAAFAQARALVALDRAGILSTAAPNSRLIAEIAIKLNWLAGLPLDDRRTAVDTMLEKDRSDYKKISSYVAKNGRSAKIDVDALIAFELDSVNSGSIHQQVTRLAEAVKNATVEPWSIYWLWLEDTLHSHASSSLAGAYAPSHDNEHLHSGVPREQDGKYSSVRLMLLMIAVLTSDILLSEGYPVSFSGRLRGAALNISTDLG